MDFKVSILLYFVLTIWTNAVHSQDNLGYIVNADKKTLKYLSGLDDIQIKKISPYNDDLFLINGPITLKKDLKSAYINYEMNDTLHQRQTPNDEYYGDQWNFELIEVDRVWQYTTGGLTEDSKNIVVAVLDEGFDIEHSDLSPNLWVNSREVVDNIDNDMNGYIDDIHGYNMVNNHGSFKKNYHGNGVAGIIGAVGDNEIGVAGMNWNIDLMLLQIKSEADVIEALEYVRNQRQLYNNSQGKEGQFIVATNMSSGFNNTFPESKPILCATYDRLLQEGILNIVATDNRNIDIDKEGDLPSLCPSDGIISVTSVNRLDEKVTNAGYSALSVDIGSPGSGVPTLSIDNEIQEFSGTSFATPHVTGSIALLYSKLCTEKLDSQNMSARDRALLIRSLILENTDFNTSLNGLTVSNGRLNVYKAIRALSDLCFEINDRELALRTNTTVVENNNSIILNYNAEDVGRLTFELHDITGKSLYRKTIQPLLFNPQVISIDLAQPVTPGIYFVRIAQNDQVEVIKIVIP